jgi:threonine/homoserine/homoserine lactone efflux protein
MNLFTFLLAVLLLELTPGPNMAYLANLARQRQATLIQINYVGYRRRKSHEEEA